MFDDVNNTKPEKEEGSKPNNDNIKPASTAPVPPEPDKKDETTANISTPPVSAPFSEQAGKGESAGEVEDMFADSDKESAAKPAAFQPKPVEENLALAEEELGKRSIWRKIAIPLVLVVGLGLLGVGGVYGYQAVIKYLAGSETVEKAANSGKTANDAKTAVEPEPNTEPDREINVSDEPAAEPIASPPASIANTQDSDEDGLTDAEEAALGTDAKNVDTDNDGLFDREEVKVYKSNPLIADTDGDGYSDGDEVKAGYNPIGEGKLYEIRQ